MQQFRRLLQRELWRAGRQSDPMSGCSGATDRLHRHSHLHLYASGEFELHRADVGSGGKSVRSTNVADRFERCRRRMSPQQPELRRGRGPASQQRPHRLFTYPRTNINDVAAANKTGIAPYTQTGAQRPAAARRSGLRSPIPRHYYTVDAVEFCDNRNITADAQWRGFGTGTCQAKNDLTQYKNVRYGPFHRWDLLGIGLQSWTYQFARRHGLPGRPGLAGGVAAPAIPSRSITRTGTPVTPRASLPPRPRPASRSRSLRRRVRPDRYRVGFQNLGEELPPGRRHPDHLGERERLGPAATYRLVQRALRHQGQRIQDADAFRDAAHRQPVREGRPGRRRSKGEPVAGNRGRSHCARQFRRARSAARTTTTSCSRTAIRTRSRPTTTPANATRRCLPALGGLTETPPDRVVTNLPRRAVAQAFPAGIAGGIEHACGRRGVLLDSRPARRHLRRAVKNDVPSSSGNKRPLFFFFFFFQWRPRPDARMSRGGSM